MLEILKPLLSMNLFSRKELETAKPVQNICEFCKEECGNIFLLDNCTIEICGKCLDQFYDDHVPTINNELFKCPCHDNPIFSYNVKGK